MSEIAKVWFDEAKKLEVGQALFIRAANKKEQTTLQNEFEKEREIYAVLSPVHASQIFISKVLKERKQYVSLERRYRAPFMAFMRDAKGNFTKVFVDTERKRMLTLMLKDKKSQKEVEEALGGLTEEELKEYFSISTEEQQITADIPKLKITEDFLKQKL